MFDKLNLPAFQIRLRRESDGAVKVFDPQRDKWLVLTPEEWVRQHFVNYLIETLGYPKSMIANETGLKFNNMQRRCDTVVFRRNLTPACIIEYKRPDVEINQRVFDQIARYNSVLGAPYLMVSNGLRHYCCRFTGTGYEFLHAMPSYEQITGPVV